jgi:nucleotide-binding universal stress UspA family protein
MTQESTMIEKVLVGTDGSATATLAVTRAVEVARDAGARLTILSVGRHGERIAQEAAAAHEDSGVEIEALGATGEPASMLVDHAEKGDYDLLVTGNKGLTGLRRLTPVGKVPAKVAHHLPCSLLVVKTT